MFLIKLGLHLIRMILFNVKLQRLFYLGTMRRFQTVSVPWMPASSPSQQGYRALYQRPLSKAQNCSTTNRYLSSKNTNNFRELQQTRLHHQLPA